MKKHLILILGVLLSASAFASGVANPPNSMTNGKLNGTTTNTGTITGGAISSINSITGTSSTFTLVSGTVSVSGGAISGSTGAFSSTLSSTKACAAGYTRMGPNFCAKNSGAAGGTSLVRDTCTTVATLPADAKMALVHVYVNAISANSIAQRTANVESYSGNTCAALYRQVAAATAYEFSAVAAVTLATDSNTEVLPLDASADFFLKFFDDAGNTGTGFYEIVGYFD